MGEICNRLIQKFSDSQNTSARSVMVSQSYVGQRAAAPAASVTVVALPAAKPAREPASQPQDSREPFDMQPTPSSQHVHQSGSGNIYRGNKSQNVNHYGQGPGMVIASDNSVINQYFNGKRPDVMVQVFYDPHEIAALISALHPNISYVPLSIKYIFSELHKMEFIYYIDFATLPMVQAMDKLEQERQKSSNSLSYLMSHLFKIYPHDTAKLIDDILLNGFKNDDQVTHVLASIEMNALLNGMGYPNLGQFEAGTEQKRRAYFLFDHVKTYLALAVMLKNYLSCNEREFKTDNLWIMMEARYQIAFNLFNKYARLWENNYPPKNDTTLINMLSANTAEEEGQALEKREVYLTKLHLTLRRDLYLYNYETVVISGMYGSGKSTLAGQFAQESITHKAFDVVCWVNAETQEGIRSAYLKVIDWIDGVNERHHGTKRYVHTAETPLSDIQDTLGRYLSDPEA
ncbi:MAG: NB-ARC domain-containing protein, partial [Alphaproteobacteria bacterium]|nr:NB-ARC domain-containing protein [Alphaproteobacteria bacterium]